MPLNPVHGSRLSDSTDTPGREPVALTRSRTDDIARAQQAATPRTAAERRAAHKAMKDRAATLARLNVSDTIDAFGNEHRDSH